MRFLFPFMVFIAISGSIHGQTIHGLIVNNDDATPLSDVVIENLNSGAYHAISDSKGHYTITAGSGDSIRFTLLGFLPRIVVFSGENEGWFSWIAMQPQSFTIDTIIIRKESTIYQKDSLERRALFGRKVDEKPAKFRLSRTHPEYGGGGKGMVTFDAPLSAPLQRISKKYKQLRRFQERYKMDEEWSFIDSRYKPELVTELTGVKEDSLVTFMQAYPMSYAFARAASDLEIKMWIRYNYKEWIRNPIVIPRDIPMPDSEADTLKKP